MKRYKVVSSSSRKSFFQNVPVLTNITVWTPLSKTFAKNQEIFPLKISKQSQIYVFFPKKNLLSQSVSLDTWKAKLTTLPKLFRKESVFFLHIAQRSKCFGFSQNFFLEMFRWSRRMPIWGICSFRASHSFHGLTTKRYDVASLSKKRFSKTSSGLEYFDLDNLVENFCPKTRNFFHSKSANRVKYMFFFENKTFCLKEFLWTHGMRFSKLR